MPKKRDKIGFLQCDDLKSPEKFFKNLPLVRRLSGLTEAEEREAWEWRSHALRIGRKPLALFVWLMKNPNERRSKITGQDERAAGRAMQGAQHAIFARNAKQTRRQAYERYLMSRRWHQLRNAKLREQKFTCEDCNSQLSRRMLDVHHERYPEVFGSEKLRDLRILCHECHSARHPHMINNRPCASVRSVVDFLFREPAKELLETGEERMEVTPMD